LPPVTSFSSLLCYY